MAHELAGALQQAGRIRQRCAVKEPHVYVRVEYIDVAEGHISQTYNRAAVMQKLPDFVPAFSHHLKPLMRDGSQFTCMLFHPRIDGGIPLDSAVESQQFYSHHLSTFCFRELWLRNGRFARDTTKCVSAAQQRVARRRSQLTTTDTVADTAICACRMQRQVAERQWPTTVSSWRATWPN